MRKFSFIKTDIFSSNFSLYSINMPTHYDTSRRVKVQEAFEFLIAHDIKFDSRDIFKQFNVSNTVSYDLIKKIASFKRNRRRVDRSYKVTSAQMREVDQILQDDALRLKKKRLT
jgi:hypothetical protein